ncbi:MAG: ABC transporter permease [Phycisphaerales bacterium]|nr:ABC transporter permease [Phycisphaerales bacterium]
MIFLPFHYAARNIERSPMRLLLTAGGGAIVVFLVVSAVASVRALDRGVRASGTPGNVMLLGAGSEESVERSEITASTPGILAASIPNIRTLGGAQFVSPELHVPLPLRRAGDAAHTGNARDLVLVRGIEPAAFLVHPQARLSIGRLPEQGRDEALIGRSVAARMGFTNADFSQATASDAPALAPAPAVFIDDIPYTLTGIIDAPGVAIDGEIWVPISDLLVRTKRQTISVTVVSLASGDASDLEVFAARRSDLELAAIDEPAYYAQLAQFFRPVQIMIGFSALIVALGAMLGGLNALDAAFASRSREIATLQVLGYSRTAVITSLVQESLITIAAGALPALVIAALLLDGIGVRFSMGIFSLSVDATCIASGLGAAFLLGILGSLPPAIRCLRASIPSALKSDLA